MTRNVIALVLVCLLLSGCARWLAMQRHYEELQLEAVRQTNEEVREYSR